MKMIIMTKMMKMMKMMKPNTKWITKNKDRIDDVIVAISISLLFIFSII